MIPYKAKDEKFMGFLFTKSDDEHFLALHLSLPTFEVKRNKH